MFLRLRQTGLSVRIVVPVSVLFVLCVVVWMVYLWRAASSQAVEAGVLSAQATVTQFKTLRTYYTEHVVNKVKAAGGMRVSASHDGADAIPLPATMIHDLSEILGRNASGTRIRLYSQYPFPRRATRQLDAFARAALDELQKNPDAIFVRAEPVNGRQAVRVAIADKMTVQACVTCHNSDPDSPKKDWRLNQVRGALEVIVPIDRQLAATQSMLVRLGVLALGGLAAVVVLLISFTRRSISNPIRRVVLDLRQGARQVSAASTLVATSAESLSHGATAQAASLEQTSASMEEMASMTRQNAEHAQAAASVMGDAERLVHNADTVLAEMVSSMAAINESADKVGRIIKTIDEIAFQTNILALNAAVEAARAGQAGMGFAVVAEEVRSLAQRSAGAAKDTATLIEESIARATAGQDKVTEAATAIRAITASSTKVKGLVEQMASASRQQAQGIAQVSQAVSHMERVTQTTAATAEESAAASHELRTQADTSLRLVAELATLVAGTRAIASRDDDASLANDPAADTDWSAEAEHATAPERVVHLSTRSSRIVSPEKAARPLRKTGTSDWAR